MPASATKATVGYGAQLELGTGSGPIVYAPVLTEITSITPPSRKRDTAEATNLTSPSEAKEFIAALMDSGEVAFEGNYLGMTADTEYAALEAVFASGALSPFKIVPAGAQPAWNFIFSAIVTEIAVGKLEKDKPVVISGKLKISGPVTEA